VARLELGFCPHCAIRLVRLAGYHTILYVEGDGKGSVKEWARGEPLRQDGKKLFQDAEGWKGREPSANHLR
jgi:hypothetical protein